MKRQLWLFVIAIFLLLLPAAVRSADQTVKEVVLDGPNDVAMKLRMEGPTTADVPLQVVCYFKYTPELAKRMTGAPVELDKELGGVISALRQRGEFVGNTLETILIIPPSGSIKPKALLLVGLGDEAGLSLDRMEQVGTIALREAAHIGADRVAFAPLIRDQGNSALDTGEIERAVTRGVLLAYDTEKRLQKDGFAKPFALHQWIAEAGPTYFDSTEAGLQKGIDEAKTAIANRSSQPLSVSK